MVKRRPVTRKQVVVGICLVVAALHFVTGPTYRGPWPAFVNGYLIDILLPFALYLLLGVSGLPVARSQLVRGIIVFAIGGVIELLQYVGVPLFGATFDVLDLVMYAVGVVGAVIFERTVVSRLEAGSPGPASRDAGQPSN
jgi:hypothetical protein